MYMILKIDYSKRKANILVDLFWYIYLILISVIAEIMMVFLSFNNVKVALRVSISTKIHSDIFEMHKIHMNTLMYENPLMDFFSIL